MIGNLHPDFEKWATFVFDPAGFVREVIGAEPDEWQCNVMQDIVTSDKIRTAVRSCHGPGKTTLLAWLIIFWLCTRPYPRVACSAPTENQLLDKLWPEAHKWLRKSRGELLRWFAWEKSKIYLRTMPSEWFAVARAARVTKDASGNDQSLGIQGWHNDNMLFLLDEGSGVADAVYSSVEGALSTGGGSRLVAMGNPNLPAGWFYNAFMKFSDKWNTHKISYKDSPRISDEWAQDMIDMYGINHPWVRVRVLAEFPNSISDGLLSLDKIIESRDRNFENARDYVTLGADVSTASGANKTIFALARRGHVYAIEEISGMELADLALEIYSVSIDIGAKYVVVDSDGIGIGVVEPLAKLLRSHPGAHKPILIKWHGSASANDKSRYLNARAELCWKIKMDVEKSVGIIRLPSNENFERQGCAIRYYVDERTERIKIASKKEIIKIIKESPDEFDATTYALVPFVYEGGFIPSTDDGLMTADEFIL